ncbi:hypothetical protein SNEBB_007869 [Seison nebaliae]|nr:hypothetical protein SNEBB_007869 [Seison nebaliae]
MITNEDLFRKYNICKQCICRLKNVKCNLTNMYSMILKEIVIDEHDHIKEDELLSNFIIILSRILFHNIRYNNQSSITSAVQWISSSINNDKCNECRLLEMFPNLTNRWKDFHKIIWKELYSLLIQFNNNQILREAFDTIDNCSIDHEYHLLLFIRYMLMKKYLNEFLNWWIGCLSSPQFIPTTYKNLQFSPILNVESEDDYLFTFEDFMIVSGRVIALNAKCFLFDIKDHSIDTMNLIDLSIVYRRMRKMDENLSDFDNDERKLLTDQIAFDEEIIRNLRDNGHYDTEMQDKISNLTSESANLKKKFSNIKTKNRELTENLQEIEQQYQMKNNDIEHLKSKLDHQENEKNTMREKIKILKEDLRIYQDEYDKKDKSESHEEETQFTTVETIQNDENIAELKLELNNYRMRIEENEFRWRKELFSKTEQNRQKMSELDEIMNEKDIKINELEFTLQELGEQLLKAELLKEEHRTKLETTFMWQRDEEINNCNLCNKTFNTRRRKHHCRNCGRIFCGACTSYRLPLNRLNKSSLTSSIGPSMSSTNVGISSTNGNNLHRVCNNYVDSPKEVQEKDLSDISGRVEGFFGSIKSVFTDGLGSNEDLNNYAQEKSKDINARMGQPEDEDSDMHSNFAAKVAKAIDRAFGNSGLDMKSKINMSLMVMCLVVLISTMY